MVNIAAFRQRCKKVIERILLGFFELIFFQNDFKKVNARKKKCLQKGDRRGRLLYFLGTTTGEESQARADRPERDTEATEREGLETQVEDIQETQAFENVDDAVSELVAKKGMRIAVIFSEE